MTGAVNDSPGCPFQQHLRVRCSCKPPVLAVILQRPANFCQNSELMEGIEIEHWGGGGAHGGLEHCPRKLVKLSFKIIIIIIIIIILFVIAQKQKHVKQRNSTGHTRANEHLQVTVALSEF